MNWWLVTKQATNWLLKLLFVDAYLDWLGWGIFGTKDPYVPTCVDPIFTQLYNVTHAMVTYWGR